MKNDAASRKLLRRLGRELYQAEASCLLHARREAARLGDVPPSTAMLDVAHHADHVVRTLPGLLEREGFASLGLLSALTGLSFSAVRRAGLDRVLGPERSFRITLLAQRHGIDLVYELEHLAQRRGDAVLAGWCREWLERRVPLVTAVERQLVWFVANPERALAA